jgi:hypothetical protein
MIKKELTKKEIFDTFKIIRKEESKYNNYLYEKEENTFSLEQKDVWIVSDSSTSFANFNQQNYA